MPWNMGSRSARWCDSCNIFKLVLSTAQDTGLCSRVSPAWLHSSPQPVAVDSGEGGWGLGLLLRWSAKAGSSCPSALSLLPLALFSTFLRRKAEKEPLANKGCRWSGKRIPDIYLSGLVSRPELGSEGKPLPRCKTTLSINKTKQTYESPKHLVGKIVCFFSPLHSFLLLTCSFAAISISLL